MRTLLERRHANSGRSTDRPSRNLPDARSSADHPLPLREGANGWQGCTRVGSKMVVTSVGNAVGKRLAMVCLAGSRKHRTVGTAVGKPEFQLKVGNSTVGNVFGSWQGGSRQFRRPEVDAAALGFDCGHHFCSLIDQMILPLQTIQLAATSSRRYFDISALRRF